MSLFSRGSGDVLDLPEMQRRGFVKFAEPVEQVEEIDFTAMAAPENKPSESEEKSSSAVSDFMSDFASIGSSNAMETKSESIPNNGSSDSTDAVADLKWRLENTEYKMEQLIERLIALEKKFH